jgi:asparagine synthase (glutamine-hydrolysing)
MCGIIGSVGAEVVDLGKALDVMRHRGPDACGVHEAEYAGLHVCLGHVRLSIVDLSHGADQPFISACGRYIIVFNGEIYNFEELRKELEDSGSVFRTGSDTEVLLALYIEHGVAMLDRLDGMFAFAIHDTRSNRLFCARDPLGIKPFYYHLDEERREFFFASEILPLACLGRIPLSVRKEYIAEFLLNGWLYGSETGFAGISKLLPGEWLEICLKGFSVERKRYFDLCNGPATRAPLETLVEQSIRSQASCGVQAGLFYSGGIDSSVIAASLEKGRLKALMLQYDPTALRQAGIVDDFSYSGAIARKLGLDVEWIGESDRSDGLLELARRVAAGNEELISDLTFTAMEAISKEAAARNYKVMLSGMGADEIFAGYPRYHLVKYKRFYTLVGFLIRPGLPILMHVPRLAKKLQRFYGFVNARNFEEAYTSTVGVFSKAEVIEFLGEEQSVNTFYSKLRDILCGARGFSNLKRAMYLDLYGFLAHNFAVADKASMRHGIELRVPLATPTLARACFAAPDKSLIGLRKTKKPLREILYRKLPGRLVDRRKTGFNPPIDCLVTAVGKEELLNLFASSVILKFIIREPVFAMIHRHFDGVENNSYKIWQLVYLHAWLERASSVYHAEFT